MIWNYKSFSQQIDLILPEKNIDGCKQHFRIDPIPGSMFPLQTPIVAT